MLLIKYAEVFEKYLHYMVGQAQAEACVTDKTVQQYFKVLPNTVCISTLTFNTWVNSSFITLIYCSLSLIAPQELPKYVKPDAPVMDVLTFLQRPVERIQTYQALLKVGIQFYVVPIHM